MARKKKEVTNVNETINEEMAMQEMPSVDDSLAGFYDPEATKINLEGLASLSKETKKSIVSVTDNQIRFIIDNYYQTQKHRMAVANQIRAVEQGFDTVKEGESPAIAWLLADIQNRENQIKLMISEYVKLHPVCQWATAVKGIGPLIAANLFRYLDISKCQHANQFLSYAGQNDNNCPWLGKEKAKEIVDEAYNHFNLSHKESPTDDVLLRVATNSGRTLMNVKRNFLNRKAKYESNKSDKAILIDYMSMPPYNTELKKLCYLIGESFVKVSNRGSLYGEIYKERKALETMRNENLEYKEQAERMLKEMNYSKTTDTYKCLSEGKLSPAHINMRAKRYAVKIFLTHFFEASYIYAYKKNPPDIYPIAHQGHVDYIEPEVPYENFFVWDKSN